FRAGLSGALFIQGREAYPCAKITPGRLWSRIRCQRDYSKNPGRRRIRNRRSSSRDFRSRSEGQAQNWTNWWAEKRLARIPVQRDAGRCCIVRRCSIEIFQSCGFP
ncbi:hypothetical protein DFH09DRAFT_1283557, partial [Mycena vulgaris]